MINAVLRLRRDNDYNYQKIKDTFIPMDGEICLVDTARDGLRAVCGDGASTFSQLSYLNDLIQKGYLIDGIFYEDSAGTTQLRSSTIRVYIDISTSLMYHYDGEKYVEVGTKLPTATASTPGILKLYDGVGQNTDGTMTQKAITDELNSKVELTLNEEEEMIVFSL